MHQQFIVEGDKSVIELMSGPFEIIEVYALEEWMNENASSIQNIPVQMVSQKQLDQMSGLSTPNRVIALVKMKHFQYEVVSIYNELILILDHISDPGNLGTIIRTADWFGIGHVFCSENTVEFYNPKVIQASMGSFTRVKVIPLNLAQFISSAPSETPIYGAFIDSPSIYKTPLSSKGMIIIGSEAKGISDELAAYVNHPISIPRYIRHQTSVGPESLNASIATALVLNEFRRNEMNHND
ncbi:MAG: RNA methyltransferase [Bacteroidota bacterium]